jgi:hypothetical protein
MLGESEIDWAKGNSIAGLLMRECGDVRGGNWVKVRKYEGEAGAKELSAAFSEAKEKSSWGASFALAGVIVILALGDLRILFTSY